MTPEERSAALGRIADEVRTCTACRLHRGRTRAVPGEGHPDTEVVFVGEGPGQNEDQQGRPFVGAAGGLLEELLGRIGWRRDEVFITNVVKCRPPGNRDPEPDEIAACSGFLRRQLEILDPAVIVTLGRFSLGTFMPGAKISSTHGTVRAVDPATGASSAVALAMYHPAAAFRQANLRDTLVADMANLPQVLLDARAARVAAGDAKDGVEDGATRPMEDGSTESQASAVATPHRPPDAGTDLAGSPGAPAPAALPGPVAETAVVGPGTPGASPDTGGPAVSEGPATDEPTVDRPPQSDPLPESVDLPEPARLPEPEEIEALTEIAAAAADAATPPGERDETDQMTLF